METPGGLDVKPRIGADFEKKGKGEKDAGMPVIVDGNNVLHVTGVLAAEIAGPDVGELVGLIEGSRYGREQVTVVCDGGGPTTRKAGRGAEGRGEAEGLGGWGGVKVVWSGRGRSADDVIVGMVEASSAPGRLVVVSTDGAIIRAARRRRCKTVSSEEFLAQLGRDHAARQRSRKEGRKHEDRVEVDAELIAEAERLLRGERGKKERKD